MTDLATLGIEIDSRGVKQGVSELDKLSAAGARAEAATVGLGRGSKTASIAAAEMAAQAQVSARAASGFAIGATTATAAVNDLGHGSALATRELLVLAREASRGNFTRMAGSATILSTALQSSGQSVKGLVGNLLTMFGVLKTTTDAELAAEAASAAAAAQNVRSAAARAESNILAADTETLLAEAALRNAATATESAAAQVRLAAAHEAVAAAAAEAAIAEDALSVAQGRAAETAAAAATTTRTSYTALGIGLGSIAVAAAVAFGAFKAFQMQVSESGELDRYVQTLGLTEKQIKNLKDVTVTFGDVMAGVWKTIADHTGADDSIDGFKKFFINQFELLLKAGVDIFAQLYGDIVGTYRAAIVIWQNFPAALGDVFYSAVNDAIGAINKLLKAGQDGVNNFIHSVNSAFGTHLGDVAAPQIAQVANQYAGAAKKVINAVQVETTKATAEARKSANALIAETEKNILDASKKRIKGEETPPNPKKKGDHGLAEALAELDAQIKGQLALAAAYQVSDAAAMRAEAMQKAEEQAIKHKGEVGVFYEKELALAVATRAAEGAKVINQLSGQTAAQKAVNDAVAAGTMTVAEGTLALKDEAQIRPLLAAYANAEGKAKDELGKVIARLRNEQKLSNDETNRAQVLAATASSSNQIEQLQLEATLIGQTNAVRAVAIAQLQAEQFLKDHPGATPEEAQRYIDGQKQIAQLTADNTTAQDTYNQSLSYMADLMALINDRTQLVAGSLSDAFGKAGSGIGATLSALSNYAAVQAKLDQQHNAAIKAGTSDEKERKLYTMASNNAQLQGTMQVISGLKTMFKEHSVGYQAMAAAEKALAVVQAIQTVKSIAAGAAKMFSQLGVWAFPAVAAMVAVMAGLGFSGGTSTQTPPTSADDLQAAAGTGTVLGSPKDKSASIANSLEIVAKNSNSDLQYSNQMLIALRSIDNSIGAMAAAVAQQIGLSGSAFDTLGLKLGTNSSGSNLGGIFGVIGTLLFGKKTVSTSLFDQGVQFNSQSLSSLIQGGIQGAVYDVIQTVTKKSSLFGLISSTKTSYSTTTNPLDSSVSAAIQQVFASLENGLVAAANVVGIDGAKSMLDGFQVNIGKFSTKGLDAKGIQDQLNAIFSSVSDQMAQFLFPALASMQKVGEGLFETFTRVAKEYETVDVELKSIGRTFGAVGVNSIAARDALVQMFGGLDEFVSATDAFRDKFLTQAEQIAPIQASVVAEMQRLGESGITTREQFKNLVLGLDLTTDSGRQMYASLLAVAPAFDKVLSYFDSLNKTTVDGLQQTIDKFNQFADTLKKYRDTLFDTGATQAATTAILQAKFNATAALAGSGDATALGNLQNDAKAYLDSAKLSAGSYIEYQRALAQVAAGVDKGIFAAESTADYAQLQLDALNNATTILQGINANTATIADALHSPPVITSPTTVAPISSGPDAPATQADIQALRDDINAGLTAIAISSGTTAKVLYNASNGDYLRIGNDPDTGLTVLP